MARYSKPAAKISNNVPHRVSVGFIVQTAWGHEKAYKMLETVYPNQKLAMAACHEFVNGGEYMSAQPVAVI